MKKTLLFVMAAAASASLWAQNKEYKIEVSVSDAQKEGKYVLRTKDLPEKFFGHYNAEKRRGKKLRSKNLSIPKAICFWDTSNREKTSPEIRQNCSYPPLRF